ncbi:MAG: hypothetical protein HY609_05530 [Deltaproteobacteria bacterium]|nr:hypothetical protein [Deltaproteobacteria bacterium]MBI4224375.1 hypothetical protein [Deltaproteobacteria bacterium]
MNQKNKKRVEKIFQAKRKRRQELARLPVEEKFKILLQIQKIACSILKERGIKREPWGESVLGK